MCEQEREIGLMHRGTRLIDQRLRMLDPGKTFHGGSFYPKSDLGITNDQEPDTGDIGSEDAQDTDGRPYHYQPDDHELSDLLFDGVSRDCSPFDQNF